MNVKGILLDLDGVLYTGDRSRPRGTGGPPVPEKTGLYNPVRLEYHQEKPEDN